MNIDKLLKALDDESNETLFNFTTEKIRDMTLDILEELQLSKKETTDIFNKLKNYKYVDEMDELKTGSYIRWIPIKDPENIYLSKGAVFCQTKITSEGVYCVCKNVGYSLRHFLISLDENLIFQKLTDQELILLSALDHLSK